MVLSYPWGTDHGGDDVRRFQATDLSSHQSSASTGAATPALDEFRTRYYLRESARPISQHEDVPIQLGDGLRLLQKAPVSDVVFGYPPQSRETSGCNTYLWVIDDRGIPYLIESAMDILDGNVPKHTNLTGGKPAYIGGQLWFSDTSHMLVSGGSGRFPPLDEDQLAAAIAVFSSFKYKVTSLGWDEHGARRTRAS